MSSHTDEIVTLDADGFDEACRQTHPLWHQGLDLAAYKRRLEEAFRRMPGEMRYAGIRSDDGALAASARLLDADLRVGSASVPTCGIAAVFVAKERRGQGWGARLIRSILADAAGRGRRLALLFSDIGIGYYERLGFRPFHAQDWTASTDAIPDSGALVTREAAPDDDSLRKLYNDYADRQGLCPHRTAAWWSYFRWWRAARPDLILVDGDREVGYAAVRTDEDHLHVFEWVAPTIEPGRVWATLRNEALQKGKRALSGWLQPGRMEKWMDAADRSGAIPMLASTGGPPVELPEPAVFEELDHF